MLDVETHRRHIGLFQQRRINYKDINEVFTNSSVTAKKKCSPNNTIILKNAINWKKLLVLLMMTTTILWTPQETHSSKKCKQGKSFSN